MNAAARAWQRFQSRQTTIANAIRDFDEWHLGRPRYAVWAIALEPGPWDGRLTAAAQTLDGLLIDGYRRQPHITLHACGFPAQWQHHNDDFIVTQFQSQCNALQGLALQPFELQVLGLGSFATAPYLEVHDSSEALPRLRAALAVGGCEFRDSEYVPHVTVGLYGEAYPVPHVAERISRLRQAPPLPLRVRRLALMTYDSRVIGGPLETLCEFDLADNLLLGGDNIFC